ncbi:MAG: hypothetical protein JNK82_45850 [Myxococcaceae bacterium]|nr:hypothetical protein [Myxococcaceae bacterium]
MNDEVLAFGVGLLVVLDGGFAGYRARAGRFARIRRLGHDLRAVARGGFIGLFTFAIAVSLALALSGGALFDVSSREAAARILWVAGGYAVLVIAAFVPFLTGSPDLRSLTTVVVFGPLTLLRPALIIGACVYAAWGQSGRVMAAVAVGGALVLMQDAVLDRLARREPRL